MTSNRRKSNSLKYTKSLGVYDYFLPSSITRFLALDGTVFVILLMSRDQLSGIFIKFRGRQNLPVNVYFKEVKRLYLH